MLPEKKYNVLWWGCLTLLLILSYSETGEGKNILFFFGMSTYSHRIIAWPLALKLAEQGHSVTFLQAVENRNPHPNITEMVPDKVNHPVPPDFVTYRSWVGRFLIYPMAYMLPVLGTSICSEFLSSQKNVEWVNSNKFDLVFVDALFNDCGYGLAWKWKAKTILFTPTHHFPWFSDSFGFPDESNSHPDIVFSSDMPLGFLGRAWAAFTDLLFHLNREFRYLWPITWMLRDKLNMPEMPAISELQKNTSLILVNTHFSEELPRSLPPLVVPIGGMHVSGEVKPLPKNMEEFVKDSAEGFIYISFGSEVDIANAPEYIKEIFFNAVGKSKAKFLWRWTGERPSGMPGNVLTSKWMPQQDVLGHPKCKGFITHGGLLGMQEAVYYGVPMVSFPVFAEQDYNSERIHRLGRGIRLELSTLRQSELEDAINRLLTDSSLKEKMQLASLRFKDRKESPLELAMWWVDYVFRHDDTTFMRPLGINQYWFQKRQLDTWAFILIIFLVSSYFSVRFTKLIIKRCFFKRKNTDKADKHSKIKKKD